jgi:hypothetical protein
MREAIRRSSKAIKRKVEVLCLATHLMRDAIRCNQMQSDAIRCNQMSSVASPSLRKLDDPPSDAIRCNQMSSSELTLASKA